MKKILLIGATSAIAQAVSRRLAHKGSLVYLVARDEIRLEATAADLAVRGSGKVGKERLDINDFSQHEAMLDRADAFLGGFDTALICHGTLGDQKLCEGSVEQTMQEITTNALSVVALLTRIANRLEQRRHGTIAVISSVAGDRGRASNYVYGSAKALVSAFLSGLRQRLDPAGVAVVTIKPGFIDTPMTASFSKGLLWRRPEAVAGSIERSLDGKGGVVYVPAFWRAIMFVIRAIPERVFRRLQL